MKNKRRIKEIIVNRYGIKTIPDYAKYLQNRYENKTPPTAKEIFDLSPDNINNYDFWKLAEDMFDIDPVCNQVDCGPNASDKIQANRNNFSIAMGTDIVSPIDRLKNYGGYILEIGPGYGSLKNYIECNTICNYIGFDVHPKSYNINKLNVDGTFPNDYISNNQSKFHYIFSTNVFQHLSDRQRIHFIQSAAKLLVPGGTFMFNVTVDTGLENPMRASDGRIYTMFYGQFTPVNRKDFYIEEAQKAGLTIIRQIDTNHGTYVGLHFIKQ